MTEPTQQLDLDAILVRAQAATPGPWEVSDYYDDIIDAEGGHLASYWLEADGQFMAHAREDIDALLAEIRRLRAELAEVRASALRMAANHVRGRSSGRDFGNASLSTALCLLSDDLYRMADDDAARP